MTDILEELTTTGKLGNMNGKVVSVPKERVHRPILDMSVTLYKPLVVDPLTFNQNYNLDIETFVERHKAKEDAQSKGGANALKRDILYLSYSHAFRFFREKHPGWEVDCAMNPLTGGYLFEEIDRRGYFIKSFVHDGEGRSAAYYNALLTMSGAGIPCDDVKSDYKTGKAKTNPVGEYIYVVDSQTINKAVYRAMVKAIALTTGIGLKLWTGDDLSEDVMDAKMALINQVQKLAENYSRLTGKEYPNAADLSYMSPEGEIKRLGRALQQDIVALKDKSETELVSK